MSLKSNCIIFNKTKIITFPFFIPANPYIKFLNSSIKLPILSSALIFFNSITFLFFYLP